jgi:hypothetical protein
MRRRWLEVTAVGAVLAALVVLLRWTAGTDDAQGSRAARTLWGEPDLQGLWANEYQIPLQRPAEFGTREFLTDAEVAERDKQAAATSTFSARTAPRGTEQDVAGAYDVGFQPERRPTGRRTSMIVDPPDGRLPPSTPLVQQRRREMEEFRLALMQAVETCKTTGDRACAGVKYGPPSPRRAEPPPHYIPAGTTGAINRADGPEDFGLGERCLAGQLPNLGSVQRIVQAPGVVSILYEGWHRAIPVTATPHPPAHIRQWRGDSRGRWEGDTLVVDVANFTPKTDFQGSRENLHLVERFTRVDANTLEYVVTIEDPTAWTRPWTFKVDMTRQNEQENRIYDEPRCHDGNYSMTSMLMGARVDEQAYAKGQGPHPATKCYVICGFGNPDLSDSPAGR